MYHPYIESATTLSYYYFFNFMIDEQAKRARRYLVMSMESRDIYIYTSTSVSNTHVRVIILRMKFKS